MEKSINLKKWTVWVIAILLIYAVVISTINFYSCDSQKIGYIRSGTIIKNYKNALKVDTLLQEETNKYQENIKELQNQIDSLNFMIIKNSERWSLKKKNEIINLKLKKETDLKQYAQIAQQKISAKKQELMKPVYEELNKLIAEYARENNYKMILGTLEGNIVYAEEAINITDEIIKFINR